MARRSKLTPEVQAAICDAIRAGATYEAAANAAGIAYSTFGEWRNDPRPKYLAFSEAVRAAEAEGLLENVRRIREAGRRDWRAAAWLLERRHKKAYGQQVAITGEEGGPVEIGVRFVDYRTGLAAPTGGSGDDSDPPGEG